MRSSLRGEWRVVSLDGLKSGFVEEGRRGVWEDGWPSGFSLCASVCVCVHDCVGLKVLDPEWDV